MPFGNAGTAPMAPNPPDKFTDGNPKAAIELIL